MKYKKNLDFVEKKIGKNLLLFNVLSGKMFELNQVASLIWLEAKDSFSEEDLKKLINKRCLGITKDFDKDLKDVLSICLKKDILKKDGKN